MEDHGSSEPHRYHALPVLALSGHVLFPHTLEPLQLFDASCQTMLDDCLADRRLLFLVAERPGGGDSTFDVGALGRVVSDRRLSGGRTTLFVHGLERVRVRREISEEPWRVVDVGPLLDDDPADQDLPDDALAGARARVVGLASNLARELGAAGAALSRVIGSTLDAGVLSHRIASLTAGGLDERQRLLESTSPLARCLAVERCLLARLLESGPSVPDDAGWVN